MSIRLLYFQITTVLVFSLVVGSISRAVGRFSSQKSSTEAATYYFISQAHASCFGAENDCKAFLGENAGLLYIETQKELDEVTSKFQNFTGWFWISGWFGSSNVIPAPGNVVGTLTSWDKSDTDVHFPGMCIAARYNGLEGKLEFCPAFGTENLRYICKWTSSETENLLTPVK